jgi:hypothetical protein
MVIAASILSFGISTYTTFNMLTTRLNTLLTQTYPFEACFGYFPKYPLDFIFGKILLLMVISDIDREKKFIEKIQLVHQMVQEQLEKSQAKYKARHDKHNVDHKNGSRLER